MMPSVEALERKLSLLEGGGFYCIEDYVIAKSSCRDGESIDDAMGRMFPSKTDDPWLVEVYRQCLERTARAALIRAGKLDDTD